MPQRKYSAVAVVFGACADRYVHPGLHREALV